MKREKFYLYSALPPEELKKRMEREARIQNRLHYKKREIVLKWKNDYEFTFRKVDHYRTSGPYRNLRAEPGRISASAGSVMWYREISYSNLLCGRIFPSEGGSMIEGCFKVLPAGCAMLWVMCAAFVLGGLLTRQPKVALGGAAISLGVLGHWSFHLERVPSSGELWDLLEQMILTIEDNAAGHEVLEQHTQDKE